jgi:hypothetical protein
MFRNGQSACLPAETRAWPVGSWPGSRLAALCGPLRAWPGSAPNHTREPARASQQPGAGLLAGSLAGRLLAGLAALCGLLRAWPGSAPDHTREPARASQRPGAGLLAGSWPGGSWPGSRARLYRDAPCRIARRSPHEPERGTHGPGLGGVPGRARAARAGRSHDRHMGTALANLG